MAASLILTRTKPTPVDDPDPSLSVFTPPEIEVFKPSSLASGVRFALVYSTAPTFTATVTIYARDAQTKSWFRIHNSQTMVTHRDMSTKCNTGAHDLWVRLTAITGGTPLQVFLEEVD